ncbi:multicopper oxidase [Bipolaris oryzae ATCC 44560]|uniref:laccase n=1 Tax=Bipolaris oryzae ATCC 44560 TaxID=930090 RepID=W6YWW2_COCMI|nr:multicopper oxidase [Bipolaris oryzae ATCC 44560]EUC40009.1 multicopper oxidase [Bipolaris oryzae ATCC 44560]
MRFLSAFSTGWLIAHVSAMSVRNDLQAHHHRSHRHSLTQREACSGNSATSRSTWCDYSIDTDYATIVPNTGVTREYWLDLTEVTVAPDGVSRTAMAVNGTIPGPTLFADWGDTVIVHVNNRLETSQNGTSIHWHGLRQNGTNDQDGVSSITQCPTAPGSSMTYTWRATQYGSTWYHSHFALQAWQGIFGGLVINGPATANYDEDLGMLFLNDWDHQTVDELYMSAQTSGPPTLDNALINGTNIFEDGGHHNHTMTVIASDLVPIQPYTTTVLDIGMGQRYDIIVTANQASVAENFWMRAIPQSACSDVENANDVRGIVYYGSSASTPSSSAYDYTDSCDDETDNLIPYVAKTVSEPDSTKGEIATVGFNSHGLFRWYLNSTSMVTNWADPTLLQILDGESSFAESNAVIELPNAGEWVYVIIETALPVPHPIHLHGHDFFVLAQGSGAYTSDITLQLDNPPRRDTAMLPASGYLALAFEIDNPGAWLMHCHIGWHTSEGFALQFVEQYDKIENITHADQVQQGCSSWGSFQSSAGIVQDDSGV